MTTTPADLLAAAERLHENYGNWKYVEAGSLYGRDVRDVCEHILATVHPDDDDPVTVKTVIPFTNPMPKDDPTWYWLNDRLFLYFYENGRCELCTPDSERDTWHEVCEVKSIGHLRQLLKALNVEGK